MKKKNIFSYLSIAALAAGGGAGLYALVRMTILRASLPAGTCPVVTFKPLIYTAIALCVLSFVFTVLEQRKRKKALREDG